MFNRETLARTYRDPVAITALAVDLFPVIAVLTLGWGLAALVFLYWLENLVVGIFAIARMLVSGAAHGIGGVALAVFCAGFFSVHYGMFCFVHGQFLNVFAGMSDPAFSTAFQDMTGLVETALQSGERMTIFIGAILAFQIVLLIRDFVLTGDWRKTNPMAEMFRPYGRIVVLHIAIFAGAGALVALGEPLLGVLGLILLRAVWGIYLAVRRRLQRDGEHDHKDDAPSPNGGLQS